jgi:hypothetical protein
MAPLGRRRLVIVPPPHLPAIAMKCAAPPPYCLSCDPISARYEFDRLLYPRKTYTEKSLPYLAAVRCRKYYVWTKSYGFSELVEWYLAQRFIQRQNLVVLHVAILTRH